MTFTNSASVGPRHPSSYIGCIAANSAIAPAPRAACRVVPQGPARAADKGAGGFFVRAKSDTAAQNERRSRTFSHREHGSDKRLGKVRVLGGFPRLPLTCADFSGLSSLA